MREKICVQCNKIFDRQIDKLLIALCKAKKIDVCSIDCYNDWEAEQEGEINEELE